MHMAAGVHGVNKHLFRFLHELWIYACLGGFASLEEERNDVVTLLAKKSDSRSRRCVYILFALVSIHFFLSRDSSAYSECIAKQERGGIRDVRSFWRGLSFDPHLLETVDLHNTSKDAP